MVESVLEGVGKSEKTVDEEFEMFFVKYQAMMADLNECEYSLYALLLQLMNEELFDVTYCRWCRYAHGSCETKGIFP